MYLTDDATIVAPVRLRPLTGSLLPNAVTTGTPNAGHDSWQDPRFAPSAMRAGMRNAHHNCIASDTRTNAPAASAVVGVTVCTGAENAKQAAPPRGRPR